MSEGNDLDAILGEVFDEYFEPGIDRNWLADAMAVSAELNRHYGLDLLDSEKLSEFSDGLQAIEFHGRVKPQPASKSKTAEQIALQSVQKHASVLRDLLDTSTDFGRRFEALLARVAMEEPSRAARRGRAPSANPFAQMVSSPGFGLASKLSFVADTAAVERDRLLEKEQRRREAGRKTIVMGRDLRDLYRKTYPDKAFGSYHDLTETRDGPGYLFVQMCGCFLGFPSETFANIEKMRRTMEEAKKSEGD